MRFEMQRQGRLFSATLVAVVVLSLLADSANIDYPVNPGDVGLSSAAIAQGTDEKRAVHGNDDMLPDEDQQSGTEEKHQHQPGDEGEEHQLDDGDEYQHSDEDQTLDDRHEEQQLDDGEEDQELGDGEEGTMMAGDDSDDSARSKDSLQICFTRRAAGLPRGRIGDIANGSCHSGLFNGVWTCDYDTRNETRWQLIECKAPEDLQFAGSSDFFSTGVAGALNTVKDHIHNNTLDLSIAVSLIEEISSIDLDESYSFAIEQDTEIAFDFLSSLLKQLRSLTKQERARSTSRLLRSLDLLALKYIKSSTYIDLGFVKMEIRDIDPGPDVVGIQVGQNTIILPTSDLQDALNYSSVKKVSFWFEDLSTSLLDNETAEGQMITPVISTALLCGNTLCNTSKLNLSRPVKIVLEQPPDLKTDSTETLLQCSYWELETLDTDDSFTGYWSQRGCTLNQTESTGGRIVCDCTHLTHFAVLLSPQAIIGPKHAFALSLVGYIGVPFSLIAMAITALIYGCFRSLWNMRSYIHVNLCLSLMAAQFLFLVGIDRTENQIGCSVVAVALHYLFLVSFMWMLMEGVVLYVLLVRVFVEGLQRRYIIGFTVASYGLPALYIMCFTIPLGFLLDGKRHYGSDTMCWLRYDTHFVWTFIAPVILIIITNVVLFIMVFVIIHKHHPINNKNLATIRKWIKPGISLMTVMGLTWITGVLVFDEALIPFAYMFTIFVALQGLAIFIMFVVMSQQVRETILKYVRNNLKVEFLNKCLESKTKEVTHYRSGGTWYRKESTLQYRQGLSGQGSTLILNQKYQK